MMSWLFILACSMVYWSTNAVALSGSDRFANNEKQNGAHVTLVELTKAEENDIGKLNEEIPVVLKERHKRLSDQRRAELETLIRLSKMTEKLIAGSRGGRHVDASKGPQETVSIRNKLEESKETLQTIGATGL